jgi:DNA-binding winged helix-turn-helix (wHTH) protein/tetratricopeptide (TPR) repeat protein
MAAVTKSAIKKPNGLRFGGFVVDLATGELFKHGAKVPLQDKPFQILALLLKHPNELLSRQEIIRTVWPDTFVESDLCLNVAVRRLRAALGEDTAHSRFIETVGSHGYRFIGNVHGFVVPAPAPHSREGPRLAVFPLKPAQGTQSESLASSLTELLIIQLRRLNSRIFVITPEFTTERAPKGRNTVSLCQDVSADYVVVGAVSEANGQVRVTVRLLSCHAQSCLWAESYTRSKKDLFAIEEEISRNIAILVLQTIPNLQHTSQLQLAPQSVREKYLHGCALLAKLTEPAIDRCVPLFEEAAKKYPQFPQAWVSLGNAYCALARLGIVPSRKVFPRVKTAAERALELEDLAEARTALASYYLFYEHDCNTAETNLVRALALDPRCPLALGGYAQLLAALGRHEDSIGLMRRAYDVDPFSSYTGVMLGWALYYAKNYEAALSQLKHVSEIGSSLWIGHTAMGMVLERLQRTEEAVGEFRLAVEQSDQSSLAKAYLGYGLARAGDRVGATEILNCLLNRRKRHFFSAYWIAVIYVALNEPTSALKWLELAIEDRCSWIVFLREDPSFTEMRLDQHFRGLLDRIHAPAWVRSNP